MEHIKKISLVIFTGILSIIFASILTLLLSVADDYFKSKNLIEGQLIVDSVLKLIILLFFSCWAWLSGWLLKNKKIKGWGKRGGYIFCAAVLIPYLLSFSTDSDKKSNTSDNLTNIEEYKHTLIKSTVDATNKNTPYLIDKDTRLDSSLGFPSSIGYYYTITTLTKSEVNSDFLNNTFIPNAKNKACTTPSLQVLFENNISLKYVYHDRNGSRFFDFKVTPKYCSSI
jgi:hypothetical protein